MSRNERIKTIVAVFINLIVFVLEVICLIYFITHSISGENRFIYYTNISNLSVGVLSLVNIVLLTRSLVKNEVFSNHIFSIVKFAILNMVTLTFFTVLFFLMPMTSIQEMYSNNKFITHLVAPLLTMSSYLFLEEKSLFKWRYSLFALVPPIIYSFIYVICVVFVKCWPDIYQINTKGLWYVIEIITAIFAFGLSQGFYFLKKLLIKSRQ